MITKIGEKQIEYRGIRILSIQRCNNWVSDLPDSDIRQIDKDQ